MQPLLVLLIVFCAIFIQTVTGFGLALISMPLLSELLGIQVAAPLVALIGIAAEAVLLIRLRHALDLQVVWRLIVSSLLGVPVGLWALRRVEEQLVLAFLGVLVVTYALYGLASLRLPELQQPAWAYGLGFVAGLLGGAYNISGPPVIIYGHCRRWPPAAFKVNLQAFFLASTLVVAAGHLWGGNLTALVWLSLWPALAGTLMGIALGSRLDGRLDPARSRRLVLWLLVGLGLRLLWQAVR